MEEMNYDDLAPVAVSVSVRKVRYVMLEADEGVAAQFLSAKTAAARFDDGKMVGVQGLGELPSYLLSLCVYRAIDVTPDNPKGRVPLDKSGDPDRSARVPQSMIKQWPAVAVKELFEKCKAISRIDESETPESLEREIGKLQARLAKLREASAKNSPDATRPISE